MKVNNIEMIAKLSDCKLSERSILFAHIAIMPIDSKPAAKSANINVLRERLSQFESEEGRLKGLNFQPRSSDVFAVTPPKCGTTWMQQILHQLRTGGNMEFEDISVVVPFVEVAYDMHVDMEAEQIANPRCFKTHAWYDHCPKGAKYIVIYREPCDCSISFFKFFEGWFFEPGEIGLEEFVLEFFLARGKPTNKMENASYFEHLVSWWTHRNDPNVFLLFFEEMKEDLSKVARNVASFIGINDTERINKATEMSSFGFMKENCEKFAQRQLMKYTFQGCGSNIKTEAPIIGTGTTKKAIEPHLKEAIQKAWLNVVAPATGFETYEELRQAFRAEKPLS